MYFMASPTMNDLTFSRNNYKNGLTITNIQVLEISD